MGSDIASEKEERSKQEINDMIRTLKKDHNKLTRLMEENRMLREKVDSLIENNQKMASIVREIDRKMDQSAIESKSKMVYSFQDGGMVRDVEELDKKKLELQQKDVSLQEINKQLNDLVSILQKVENK